MRLTLLFANTALAASVMLSGCAASDSSVPGGQVGAQSRVSESFREVQSKVTGLGIQPAARCPSGKHSKWTLNACYTVSKSGGLVITWCDGTPSQPCADTADYTWSGNVCRVNSATCTPALNPHLMYATWTGPFPCSGDSSGCPGGATSGEYVVDTISSGSRLVPTNTYKYKLY
jgi:hypothetical protein